MGAFFADLWQSIVGFVETYRWLRDTADILLIGFAIFSVIKLVRDSRAEQLLKGIALLLILYAASSWLDLKTTQYVMQMLFDNALIIIVVIFQPELRRALEQAGHSKIGNNLFNFGEDPAKDNMKKTQTAIIAVCDAVTVLKKQRMGALIVFERTTKLGEVINTGTVLNAAPSAELIANVFFNKAPLHDGAVIIREGQVYAASCILPLTDNRQLSSELGTRHRAAVGMSENSDALVVVVSEETGNVSIALGGRLTRGYSEESLRIAIENTLLWEDLQINQNKPKKSIFTRRKSK